MLARPVIEGWTQTCGDQFHCPFGHVTEPVQPRTVRSARRSAGSGAEFAGNNMERGRRVGAWLIGLSVLATVLLNCWGRTPHRLAAPIDCTKPASNGASECVNEGSGTRP